MLADAIHPRYRALILLAVFGSLRWGELAALRRCDIDVRTGTVRIEKSSTELPGGGCLFGPPKSQAGRRVAVVPAAIKADLTRHLGSFTGSADDALVFTSPTGATLHHGGTSGAGTGSPLSPGLGWRTPIFTTCATQETC